MLSRNYQVIRELTGWGEILENRLFYFAHVSLAKECFDPEQDSRNELEIPGIWKRGLGNNFKK